MSSGQGQTIERTRIDLRRIFVESAFWFSHVLINADQYPCTGQTYVAISRATSLDGLEIRNFEPRK